MVIVSEDSSLVCEDVTHCLVLLLASTPVQLTIAEIQWTKALAIQCCRYLYM